MMEVTGHDPEGDNVLTEAILQHIGIIVFNVTIILAKLGIFLKHPLLVLIGSLAGAWGVYEFIGSRFKTIASIGWILAFSLLMSGNGFNLRIL
jgi:hypothetical protein